MVAPPENRGRYAGLCVEGTHACRKFTLRQHRNLVLDEDVDGLRRVDVGEPFAGGDGLADVCGGGGASAPGDGHVDDLP